MRAGVATRSHGSPQAYVSNLTEQNPQTYSIPALHALLLSPASVQTERQSSVSLVAAGYDIRVSTYCPTASPGDRRARALSCLPHIFVRTHESRPPLLQRVTDHNYRHQSPTRAETNELLCIHRALLSHPVTSVNLESTGLPTILPI